MSPVAAEAVAPPLHDAVAAYALGNALYGSSAANGDRDPDAGSIRSPEGALLELEGMAPSEQVDVLTDSILHFKSVRDGAENLLQVLETQPEGKASLRTKVESELAVAKAKIAAITQKIEQLQSLPGVSRLSRKKSADLLSVPMSAAKQIAKRHQISTQPSLKEDKDDTKTALTQANSILQSLSTLSSLHPYQPSPSSHLAPADIDRARMDGMNRLATIMQNNVRTRYEVGIVKVVQAVLPALADSSSKETRAAAYRLIRHAIVDADSVEKINGLDLDWYIVRSLARDNKHAVEKEQVLKLIRSMVESGAQRCSAAAGAGAGEVPLSEPIMRALIAVAEHAEDQFRHMCLLTLAEIALIDIELVSRAGGMRPLFQSLVDGPAEIAPVLAMAFLYIVDAPQTRPYVHSGTDLEIAISGITDAYGKGASHVERMKASAKVTALMLRSWSGLMYFCSNDMHAISSLIDTMRIPSLEAREILLDMFFEVLNIKTPDWYQAFIDGRRLTMYGRQKSTTEIPKQPQPLQKPPDKLNLADQYIALLLLILVNAGLIDALIDILEETNPNLNLSRKATLLIGEVLQIANKVLPLSVAARIQSLPRLFRLASDYHEGETRQLATSTLSSIDSYNRNRARLQSDPAKGNRKRANSADDPMRRGQRQVEQAKIKMGMQIDDRAFQSLLLETQVMLTKDYTKWNFEILNDLIEGPLLNPKRLEEAIKLPRFGRRLVSFFHPFNGRFPEIPNTKSNQRFVRFGCQLLTTLIKSPEGLRYLMTEDPLLRQIADCFNQIDQFNGTPAADPIFSKQRIESTLTSGYLEMLGTLSKYPEGIDLMERFKIFTAFYHISEMRSREDLIKGIIENIDYSVDGHPRIVLSKALTSSYKHIRLYATQHLGQLIQTSPKANEWTLRLLLTQLYDPALEVCEMAVHFLQEACESMDMLEIVVRIQPTLDHLGEIGHPLLLKFMSTSVGFRYLYNADYINREMDSWFHERNDQYVVHVEVYLAKMFGSSPVHDDDLLMFDGMVPPHFYGELAKTELGCQVLQERGHFAEFARFIRQHGLESEDFDIIAKLKSILWAVGNIGSSSGGLPFLEEEEIIPIVIEIAESSLVLSVRGTCFFVIGLISSTPQGAEILDEYGWEATLTPLGTTTGLCVPLDVAKFVEIPKSDPPPHSPGERRFPPLETKLEREALAAITNLSNTVIQNEAARTLARLKARHRNLFSSIPLYHRALYTISTQHYRLPVRRYVLELFDIRLDPDVVNAIVAHQKLLEESSQLITENQGSLPDVPAPGARVRGSSISKAYDNDNLLGMDVGIDGLESFDQPELHSKKPKVVMKPQATVLGFDVDDSH